MSDKETIAEVSCPMCKAKAGDPCVFVKPFKGPPRTPYQFTVMQFRVGRPTTKPHNERRNRYWRMIRKNTLPKVSPATKTQREIVAALREFDKQEWEQMRDWLKQNATILINAGEVS